MAHGDISHVEIPADDVERAKSFYSGLFGWQLADMPGFEGYFMWQAPNKVSGGAIGKRGESVPDQVMDYVEVESVDDALAKVAELGGTVEVGKTDIGGGMGWTAQVRDTEGNRIGLYQAGDAMNAARDDADATEGDA
jgi:predicted enzyme related to lactoylglutathione lyase